MRKRTRGRVYLTWRRKKALGAATGSSSIDLALKI